MRLFKKLRFGKKFYIDDEKFNGKFSQFVDNSVKKLTNFFFFKF